jgi:hypothetical protein
MKYVLSLVAGLLLGAAAAAAILYFNPLTQGQSAPLGDPGLSLAYRLSGADLRLSTHDKRLDIPVVPSDVSLLFEDGIRGTWLSAYRLRSDSRPEPVAATRISIPSPESELLRSGLLVEDYWLISEPGAGSMFVHAESNQWPLLRDTLVRADWLGRDYGAPRKYHPTRGPANAAAEVFGLTGSYRGARGRARDNLSLDSYDGGLASLSGQLSIQMAAGGDAD